MKLHLLHSPKRGFVLRSGFIAISRISYPVYDIELEEWTVDLRWPVTLLNKCTHLYRGIERPSERRILFCAVFAPLLTASSG